MPLKIQYSINPRPPYAVTNKGLDFTSDAIKVARAGGEVFIITINCDTVKLIDGVEQGVFGRTLALKHTHASFVRTDTAWLGDADFESPLDEQAEFEPQKHFYIQLT